MANLNFGVNEQSKKKKKFTIDGDENRVIELDTSDVGIITRFNDSQPRMDALVAEMEKLGGETDFISGFSDAEKEMRNILDFIFASPVCEPIFGTLSVFAPNGDGFAFEKVIAGLMAEYESGITKGYEKINKARISKHTAKYEKK